jgi:hypothetical protein
MGVAVAPGGFLLGAVFSRPGGVIAIPLATLFGQQYLLNAVPPLANVVPWGLALPLGDGITTSVAASLMIGTPPTQIPILTVAAAILVFVVVAIRRFRTVEL